MNSPYLNGYPKHCGHCASPLKRVATVWRCRQTKSDYCSRPCLEAGRLTKAATMQSPWYLVAALLLMALSITYTVMGGRKAFAHDPHTHLADAFSTAKSKSGTLCCDGNDYTYVSPSSWERTDTGFRVYVQKQWVDIPIDALVTNMTNPDGEAKVWLYTDSGQVFARCFMPGVES